MMLPDFKELNLDIIPEQGALENYLIRTCIQGNEQMVFDVIEFNYIERRNTVVSVVNINTSQIQQQYPYIENVSHLNLIS